MAFFLFVKHPDLKSFRFHSRVPKYLGRVGCSVETVQICAEGCVGVTQAPLGTLVRLEHWVKALIGMPG